MKKKVENTKEVIVSSCINDLLLSKSEYITTGVPQVVLELKVVSVLLTNSTETDATKLREKAKSLIASEVKNESVVRASSGNYFHGPKVNQGNSQEINDSIKSDSSEPRKPMNTDDESELALSMDEEDDDDDEEEEHGAKYDEKEDEDYQPQGYPKIVSNPSRSEGRVSSRMKKSRFDSDEYVFPSILKKFNKTISRRPESSPVTQDKPVRKKRGPKPKAKSGPTGSVCSICCNVALESALLAACLHCSAKAHMFCTERELEGAAVTNWCCKDCKLKAKCSVCHNPAGKYNFQEFGVLVACESCGTKYHRPCHTPTIETKAKSWKCAKCSPNKTPTKLGKRSSEKIDGSSDQSNDQPTPKRLTFPSNSYCSNCKEKFTNVTDKLSCIVCKNSFHSGCCRVRDVPNIARLGARKNKWRCDSCKTTKGGYVFKKKNKSKSEIHSEDSNNSNEDSLNLDSDEIKEDKTDGNKVNAWWKTRLRPIVLSKEQPPLGPIPDLSVPDVSKWSCVDVENYFNDHFIEKGVGKVFIEQDIDGKALKLMRRSDVVSVFNSSGFKLDVILDVLQHVKRLQLRVNDRRYIWADVF